MLSGPFTTAGSQAYIHAHTVLVVVVGPYTLLKAGFTKSPLNFQTLLKGLGVQLCTLFVL